VELLQGWTLRGAIKGDAVKRLDPRQGPLTEIELQSFNEGAVRVYESRAIDLYRLALCLLQSNTGRRPVQITNLRMGDLDCLARDRKGHQLFTINIPRAKQYGQQFRESLKPFAMTPELWAVVTAHKRECIEDVERMLGFELEDSDKLALPLFPNWSKLSQVKTVDDLRRESVSDSLHLQSREVPPLLQDVASLANCVSERTGEILKLNARRFRYTTGTRAARAGLGPMIIAELLDESDTQNVHVYTKNVPENAAAIEAAVRDLLLPYANAFQGNVVDKEHDAARGTDLTSRVKFKGTGTGTCGSYGICGANVPIPCYTCVHFQPWLDGPHEQVYDFLVTQRDQILQITQDAELAGANDRTIAAVAEVLVRCQERRQELQQGVRD
jgi:integrase